MTNTVIPVLHSDCFLLKLRSSGAAHLEYADPVLWMWLDELCQSVVTLQRSVGQVALPHILEDDVGKVRFVHAGI